jgi:hypothetical protein
VLEMQSVNRPEVSRNVGVEFPLVGSCWDLGDQPFGTRPVPPPDGVVKITPAQLGYLLEDIDWRMPQHTWPPQPAS